MRHKRSGRKLGVVTKHRKAMLRNMVTDLFRHERIRTTDTKAKELRRVAEKMITLAKDGSLHKRRQAAAYIRGNDVLKKLFDELAERFKDRPGGYTRIIKLGFRKGDNTPVSLIELVEEGYKPKAKKTKKAATKKQPKAKETAKSSKKESAEELGLAEEIQAKEDKPKAKTTKKKSSDSEGSAAEKPKAKAKPEAKSKKSAPKQEAKDEGSADTETPGEESKE